MREFALERVDDAVEALRRSQAQPPTDAHVRAATQYLAGGTNLLDLMKLDVMRPERVVDISRLREHFGRVQLLEDGLWLGSHATMRQAGDDASVRRDYPVIADSLWQAASPQIRNMATLAGNVLQRTRCNYFRDTSWGACNKREPGTGCAALEGCNRRLAVLGVSDHCIASYPGDFAQALVALGAEVSTLAPDGTARNLPFEELHRAPGETPDIETILVPGELITGFKVPAGPWTRRSRYVKVRDRASYDFALASAAVALDLDGRRVVTARIALGGIATVPWRSRAAEQAIEGRKLDEASARASPRPRSPTPSARRECAQDRIGQTNIGARAAGNRRHGDRAMSALIGQPRTRIDGRAKVTGHALYPSDEAARNPAWAFLLTRAIARGRIRSFDLDEALQLPGVLDILTHENVGGEAKPLKQQSGGESTTTLESDQVWHGQIIGVVLADTYEIARDAAFRVRVHYNKEQPAATFDCPGAEEERREPGEHEDYDVGDVAAALASAEVIIDERYETPTQHHNPIELFTTTAEWNEGELTIWEPSQFVYGLRANVAQQIGIDPARVHVVSKFVGGAFGSKGGATARTARTAWIAIAARRLGRPVKLVATRDQGFTIATYRAEIRHHLQLAATRDGKLTALRHEGWEVTSRPSDYNVSGTETTARMYACPNVLTLVNVVHADRNTPGFMRAPPDTPYMFPLEVAMDELAVKLGVDPVELRRINDTQSDPTDGLPYSSRHLIECLDQAAERFGWAARNPQPGSMRDGDWLVGWGCASAAYPSNIASTAARATLRADGHAKIEIAGHDIGTGAYTVAAIIAAEKLGVQIGKVSVHMGDTSLPPASLAAGSSHTATITHAIAKACDGIVRKLAEAAVATSEGPFAGYDPASLRVANGRLVAPDGTAEPLEQAVRRLTTGAIEIQAEHIPDGLPPESMDKLYQGQPPMLRGQQCKDVRTYAFGAQFVEVRVHRLTCEIRVPRMVGAFASGTIVNPLTAHSQYLGGMIWGLGAALEEKTEIDLRHARYVNDNISEYHIPVNADVASVEVIMVPEADTRVNPLGIKGLGEIGIVGMNAAIANAVWHATGRRIRKLPIRIEDLL